MLVIIYKYFYRSFLQVIKELHGMKRLTHDPATTYQTGLKTIRLAKGKVERKLQNFFGENFVRERS